jgi:hypothetical protein
MSLFQTWEATRYHHPQDDMQQPGLDSEASARYARFVFLCGYFVTTDSQRPAWNKGRFLWRLARYQVNLMVYGADKELKRNELQFPSRAVPVPNAPFATFVPEVVLMVCKAHRLGGSNGKPEPAGRSIYRGSAGRSCNALSKVFGYSQCLLGIHPDRSVAR